MTTDTIDRTPSRFLGCDVGKRHIVVFDSHGGKTASIGNTPEALAAFAATLEGDCLAVCEATGGHEAALLEALLGAGIPAHRADARKVKAFIRSFGTLGKSDAIDAKALARYGAERHPDLKRWQAPDKHRVRLQVLVLTRRDLVDNRTALTNRLKAPGGQVVAECLKSLIASLDHEIQALEVKIQALLESCAALARTNRVLRAIPGLGATTAAGIIALMPELGTLTRRQAAALAGLAPHPKDSGMASGYRRTKGGRAEVKRTLFMAALAASQHHPTLRAFNQRLLEAGKKPIVAKTAVMRRLIVIANAKIRDDLVQNQLS